MSSGERLLVPPRLGYTINADVATVQGIFVESGPVNEILRSNWTYQYPGNHRNSWGYVQFVADLYLGFRNAPTIPFNTPLRANIIDAVYREIPRDLTLSEQMEDLVDRQLDSLPPYLYNTVDMRYRLHSRNDFLDAQIMSRREVAEELEITPEIVRSDIQKILQLLRHPQQSHALSAFLDSQSSQE